MGAEWSEIREGEYRASYFSQDEPAVRWAPDGVDVGDRLSDGRSRNRPNTALAALLGTSSAILRTVAGFPAGQGVGLAGESVERWQ